MYKDYMKSLVQDTIHTINSIGKEIHQGIIPIVGTISEPNKPLVRFEIDETDQVKNIEEYGLIFNRAPKLIGKVSISRVIGVINPSGRWVMPIFGVEKPNSNGRIFDGYRVPNPVKALNTYARHSPIYRDIAQFKKEENSDGVYLDEAKARRHLINLYEAYSILPDEQRELYARELIDEKQRFERGTI